MSPESKLSYLILTGAVISFLAGAAKIGGKVGWEWSTVTAPVWFPLLILGTVWLVLTSIRICNK